jgi:hypothetical protein
MLQRELTEEQQMAELIMLALLGVFAFAATMSVFAILD